jgi:selenocysteine lyase/cysteine desulfurase
MGTPDWKVFRDHFPALEGKVYLNTAGGGAMSVFAAQAGRKYYSEAEEFADTYWDVWLDRMETIRAGTARFIGAEPEDIAFIQHTSLGLNIVAHQFTDPVNVLVLDKEFPSCTTPWLSAGHKVSFLTTPADGTITPEQLEKRLGSGFDVFVLSAVQFANGFRADIREIGRLCRDRGVLFVVDATQSICACDVDVASDNIDALVFSGYKWATAGYGIAVLCLSDFLRDQAPGLIGWRSAREPYLLENDRLELTPTAIRHEMGHPSFPGIFAMGAALDLFSRTGIDDVSLRIHELSSHLRAGIQEAGFNIRSSTVRGTTSGIILISTNEASEIATELRKKSIWVSARSGGIRVSVHAYNTKSEIDEFCDALARFSAGR